MKKSISKLFDSKVINASDTLFGGLTGSKNSQTDTDTGLSSTNTYDKETNPSGGGCDTTHTGFAGGKGESDNPNTFVVNSRDVSLTSTLSVSYSFY